MGACDACLARSALLARLAGPLDRAGPRLAALLGAADDELIAAIAGRRAAAVAAEHAAFDPATARSACAAAGVLTVCRCADASVGPAGDRLAARLYPAALRDLAVPPAVVHLADTAHAVGALTSPATVAVIGTRDPSPYGLKIAGALGRDLGRAGVTVISGMARGIDAATHSGVLDAGGVTVAVLAAGAERPYPASARALYRSIVEHGAVISELPPGTPCRRWTFPARNRLIAALGAVTVVIEARAGSGSLLTATAAGALGRPLGAVPGHVTSPLAAGPHGLLANGARVVTGAADVLDMLAQAGLAIEDYRAAARGGRRAPEAAAAGQPPARQTLYTALAEGHPAPIALARAGLSTGDGLAALAALELDGLIRRQPGGQWAVTA